MTRRNLLALAAGSAVNLRNTLGQALPYPGTPYRDYSRCLPDFLRALAQKAYDKRNGDLSKLTTAGSIANRQRWVTDTLWRLAGGQLERTPLRPRVTGSFDRSGYRLEKVVYESRPEFFITANLYIPTAGTPPFPGVLFQMGHSLDGKAYDPYQRCCQGLARLGFVVLAFDPMGQGERIYYPAGIGRTRLRSADDEHTYPGKQMLLIGDTATRLQLWDAIRSLDYLASRPEVNPKKLGATGQSGGATISMLLAAVDDRLSAAVVSCGNTENVACANFNPPGSTDDAEQDLLGSGPLGFDRWDLLYPLAPKPLLVTVSSRDFFGTYSPRYIANGWEEYRKLARIYALLGHKDRLAWADSPLPHNLGYFLRLRTYQWFERWLKASDKPVEREPEVSPEPEPSLRVGRTGNVVADFGSVTPFVLNQRLAESVQPVSSSLKELLAIPELPAPVPIRMPIRSLARVPSSGGITIEAIEVRSESNVWLPAWLYTPERPRPQANVLLLIESRGRNLHWSEGGLYEKLAQAGHIVCAADVRGIGDLRPEVGRGAPGYEINHAQEENYAWSSLILGRPLLGQRVVDILAMITALRARGPVVLAADREAGVPALFASALDPKLDRTYLCGTVSSFRNIVESETYHCPLANIILGLLKHSDLPALAASISPRRLHLAGTVDAAGKAMAESDVRKLYPGSHILISPEQEWSVETLLGALV
jgi:dienelactone hydrolase